MKKQMDKPKYLLISNNELSSVLIKTLVIDNTSIDFLGLKPYNKDLKEILKHYKPDVVVADIALEQEKRDVLKDFAKELDIHLAFSSFTLEKETIPSALHALPPELVKPAISLTCDLTLLKQFLDDKYDVESNRSTDHIFIRSEKRMVKVKLAEITYIEALADYVKIFFDNGTKIITQKTTTKMMEILPEDKFMRINRSYIVNGTKIDSFTSGKIYIGEKLIPIGKGYRDVFRDLIKSL